MAKVYSRPYNAAFRSEQEARREWLDWRMKWEEVFPSGEAIPPFPLDRGSTYHHGKSWAGQCQYPLRDRKVFHNGKIDTDLYCPDISHRHGVK